MEHIETFKPQYTKEETEELVQWFAERRDSLPASLQMSDSLSTSDLKKTVDSYLRLVSLGRTNVVFSGYVAHLMLIREVLKRDCGM